MLALNHWNVHHWNMHWLADTEAAANGKSCSSSAVKPSWLAQSNTCSEVLKRREKWAWECTQAIPCYALPTPLWGQRCQILHSCLNCGKMKCLPMQCCKHTAQHWGFSYIIQRQEWQSVMIISKTVHRVTMYWGNAALGHMYNFIISHHNKDTSCTFNKINTNERHYYHVLCNAIPKNFDTLIWHWSSTDLTNVNVLLAGNLSNSSTSLFSENHYQK